MQECIDLPTIINVDRCPRSLCCWEALGLSLHGSARRHTLCLQYNLTSNRPNAAIAPEQIYPTGSLICFRSFEFSRKNRFVIPIILRGFICFRVPSVIIKSAKTFRSDWSVCLMLCSTCARISLLSFWRAVEHNLRMLETSCVCVAPAMNPMLPDKWRQQNETTNLLERTRNFLWCLLLQVSPCIYFFLNVTACFKPCWHLLS